MASPSDASGSALVPDSLRDDDPYASPDIGPHGSSIDGGDESRSSSRTCQWRTAEYPDQECSRFLDCPSHTTERPPTERPDEQPVSPYIEFRSEELPYRADRPRGSSEPNQSVGSISISTEVTSVPGTPGRDVGADEEPASSTDTAGSSPTLPSPHLSEASAGTEQDVPTQSSWTLAPTQPSSALSSFVQSNDMERDDEGLYQGPEGREEPPVTATLPQPVPVSEEIAPFNYQTPPSQGVARQSHTRQHGGSRRPSDFALPRWQPDVEVTYCPICHTQFSFFVRKHHCR